MTSPSPSESLTPQVPGYALQSVIGRGGSGVVWRAVDATGAAVAIKVVPAGVEDGALAHAAALESDALSAVAGDHVVRVQRAMPVQEPQPGLALVMELLEGGSLTQIVRDRGRLSDGELVTVLSPVAAAVGALHALGIVHGDLSSGNVLFDRQGRPHVSDLGTAAIIGDSGQSVWGTAGFVAPEVAVGAAPTAASDVYALGALGWFAATGSAPEPSVARPTLASVAPHLGEVMRGLIEAALSNDPGQRPDAIAWANAVFDAAPASALVLGGASSDSGDDVSALTRRIREAAVGAPVPEAPAASRPRGAALRSRVTVSAGAVQRAAGTARRSLLRAGQRAATGVRRMAGPAQRIVGVAVLGAVVLTIVGLGWMTFGRPAAATATEPVSAQPAATAAPAAKVKPTQVTKPAPTVASAQRSEQTAPKAATKAAAGPARLTPATARGVVQGLLDARSRLWNGSHAGPVSDAALATVHVPNSSAWRNDERTLAQAAQGRWVYSGVRFTASTVRLVGVSSTGTATVDVTLSVAAHRVSGRDGVEQRPARSQQVRMALVATSAGWRLAAVTTR